MHNQGDDYCYFSGNNEFTSKFGAKATGKTLSASIDRKLDVSVIFDGEILQLFNRMMENGEEDIILKG